MALNPSNSSNLEELALKGLTIHHLLLFLTSDTLAFMGRDSQITTDIDIDISNVTKQMCRSEL